MLTLHPFLQSIVLFVKSLTVKVTEQMYRSSSILLTEMMVVAIIAFPANGFGGGGRNAPAAPIAEEGQEEDTQTGEVEGSGLVTEAKVQFGLSNTNNEGQHLASALLGANVRERQRQQAAVQTQIKTLQKQILKERQEEEARKKAEEERRTARRIRYMDEDYQVLLRIVQAEAGICDERGEILVADVIINHVLSREFPDSIKAVVYEPFRFQPVVNGGINSVKVTAGTIACVEHVLDGEDYSGGALCFVNRRDSGEAAVQSDRRLTYLLAHNSHEFFR